MIDGLRVQAIPRGGDRTGLALTGILPSGTGATGNLS